MVKDCQQATSGVAWTDKKYDLETMVDAACDAFGITAADFFSYDRPSQVACARQAVARIAVESSGYSTAEVSKWVYGGDRDTVSIRRDQKNAKRKLGMVGGAGDSEFIRRFNDTISALIECDPEVSA